MGLTMKIDHEEQDCVDFDWFCVDAAGEVGHFTTAGFKRLPESVSSSAEDLNLITEYFEKKAPIRCVHQVDGDLEKEVPDWKDHAGRYLRSFVAMADKGLYSYDIESYLKPEISYFRVASPLNPLRLAETPEHVREVLGRTVLKSRLFSKSSRISYGETLDI
jgi:hypothetical protein